MIAKSVKSVKSADVDFAVFDADFTDFGIKLVKLTISSHSTVRIQVGNINFFSENPQNLHQNLWISLSTFKRTTCETKDHFCLRR